MFQTKVIYTVNFDPSSGKEIQKCRPAIIITPKKFNDHINLAWVMPITSTIRSTAFEVQLPQNPNFKIQGVILTHQLKAIDFQSRGVKFIEKALESIVKKARGNANIVLNG